MTKTYLNYFKVQTVFVALLAGFVVFFPARAFCQYGGWYNYSGGGGNKNSYFAIIGSYRGYTNPNTQSGVSGAKIEPSADLELDVRVYRIFSLTGIGGESPDQSYTFGGAGFRIDLPGFFLIGASNEELMHRHRHYPLNTSVHGEVVRFGIAAYRDAGLAWQSYAARGGFTVDLMLPKQDALFISLDVSFFNVNGDSFVSGACGLGLEL